MQGSKISRVVSKLDALIENRFGVDFNYFSISEKNQDNLSAVETVKRNSGAPLIIAWDSMLIPMRVKGSLVGVVRVNQISRLEPKQLHQIKQTVDLILNEALIAQDELDRVTDVLNYIETTEYKSNVINISKRRSKDDDQDSAAHLN